ncbi:MAG: sulfite exporter TauE/SafE family protein [Phycisphaerales bacterium]
MLALLGAVLLASVLGSTHCAGMCGAFLMFAVGMQPTRREHVVCQCGYHGGRLFTYVVLGAVAGGMGRALDLGAGAVGLQRGAAMFAGIAMILFASILLAQRAGVRLPRAPVPAFMQQALVRAHRAIAAWTPARRAVATGLLTTLLPCGWLYAFVIVSAGTAHPMLGALSMAVFWLGTVPLLAALGAGLQVVSGPLRRHLPVATAVIVLCMGVLTAAGRVTLPTTALVGRLGAVPGSAGAAVEQVSHFDQSALPCCNPAGEAPVERSAP